MDPITFGMAFLGVSGGSLLLLTAFDKKINQTAVKIALEVTKYGAILWFINHLSKMFLGWF